MKYKFIASLHLVTVMLLSAGCANNAFKQAISKVYKDELFKNYTKCKVSGEDFDKNGTYPVSCNYIVVWSKTTNSFTVEYDGSSLASSYTQSYLKREGLLTENLVSKYNDATKMNSIPAYFYVEKDTGDDTYRIKWDPKTLLLTYHYLSFEDGSGHEWRFSWSL